eukprot:6017648-Lingulodinium_polyedra.AAC.1
MAAKSTAGGGFEAADVAEPLGFGSWWRWLGSTERNGPPARDGDEGPPLAVRSGRDVEPRRDVVRWRKVPVGEVVEVLVEPAK